MEDRMINIRNGLIAFGILIGALLLIFGIPWPAIIHSIALFVYIKWISLLIGATLTIGVLKMLKDQDLADKVFAVGACAIATLLFMVVTGIWSNYTLASNLEVLETQRLPTAAVSWIPHTVAESYMGNHYNRTDSHPGPLDPWIEGNGEVNWIFPDTSNFPFGMRAPRGLTEVKPSQNVNNLNLHQVEGVYPRFGESEIIWLKSYQFQLLLHGNVFSRYPEIYYAQGSDQEWYAVAPLITYHPSFPQPIPSQGKVAVINVTFGEYQKLTIDQARKLLPNQWLLSKELAKRMVEVIQLKGGLVNAWFVHKDQVVPGDLEGVLHPVLIDGNYVPTWYFSLEPYGRAKGQVGYAYVDTTSGIIQYDRLDANDQMNATGFSSIVSTTQSVFTQDFNWVHDYRVSTGESSTSVKSGNSLLLEPRPIIAQGRILALMTVTGRGAENVSQAILMDVVSKEGMVIADYHQLLDVMNGTLPFTPYVPGKVTYTVVEGGESVDLTQLTTDELWQEAQAILSELKSRS